ncbi:TPA: flagellar biosynthesis protein FlhB [bacterium UBP9_UBA11836]|nr:flagellar biosynthesis protein FlhB [bacterium UBP9_UBA11836]
MGGQDSDKTEEPTEHKLQEARKKGQVMKSQEVISTSLLLATAGAMYGAGGGMLSRIRELTVYIWGMIPTYNMSARSLNGDIFHVMVTILLVLAPLLAAGFMMAIVANLAQVQFIFSTETLKPSLNKINPLEGFKRIFSVKSAVELLKQLAKLGIIGYICYKVVGEIIPQLQTAPAIPLMATLELVGLTVKSLVMKVLIGMVAIAGLDYIFQKKQFMKQMRMSMQDLKDEYKETEGNPQVKGKLRQLMRQSSQGGGGGGGNMMSEVPDASAVVTNPTHLAVALRYKQGQDPVPIVVAKGENMTAVQIKIMAEDHDVPIVENVELARALFKTCELSGPVPTEMYKAVAEVLAYVIKLKRKRELLRRRRLARNGPPRRTARAATASPSMPKTQFTARGMAAGRR